MILQAHVDRYVALKRHLGYKFVNNERIRRASTRYGRGQCLSLIRGIGRAAVHGGPAN